MADFKIGYVLLCDDVRKEITAKDILIGVYTTIINVQQLPGIVNLSAWIEIIPSKKGPLALEVKFEVPGDLPEYTVGVTVTVVDESNSFGIATPVAGFPIQKEGQIRVFVRPQGAQKWIVAKRVNVRYRPPSALATSVLGPPPS